MIMKEVQVGKDQEKAQSEKDSHYIRFTRCPRSHGGKEVERMLSCHMFMTFCAHRRRKICSSLQIYICLLVHVHKNHMHKNHMHINGPA